MEPSDDKITIIEGPPPTFGAIQDGWAQGLNESPLHGEIALTKLRTFNGAELVERCYHAWRNDQVINLEYRTMDGLEQNAPIVAARYMDTDESQLLILWVRLTDDEVELELGYEDDLGDNDDTEWLV